MVPVMLLIGSVQAGAAAAAPEPAGAPARPRMCGMTTAHLPETIQLADHLRSDLMKMLETSATFRSQCDRIARAPWVQVRVRVNREIEHRDYMARSVIHRSRSGAIVALVDIGPRGSPVEWIAHEFEHVLEQIDGVRLAELARRQIGVWRSSGDMFESARAIRAGRAVAAEMRSGIVGSDKCVE
jgi:hypothetical protein